MLVKALKFHPKALEFIRDLSVLLRRQIGEALRNIQKGYSPGMPLNRPIPSIAAGAYELRVRDEAKQVRVFFTPKPKDAIVVFHAFEKKSQKTPLHEIKLGEKRLRDCLYE